MAKRRYEPSLEEIKEECEKIRETWDAARLAAALGKRASDHTVVSGPSGDICTGAEIHEVEGAQGPVRRKGYR